MSLQLGAGQAELQAAQAQGAGVGDRLTELTAHLGDWADTAALIANLDLVITCDTGVAHLAGAMGKPTWILLAHMACWRWLNAQSHPTRTPWYPSARLFRQTRQGEWTPVLDRVIETLHARLPHASHALSELALAPSDHAV